MIKGVGVAAALALTAAACGSSSKTSTPATTAAPAGGSGTTAAPSGVTTQTIKVGVMTDSTGAAASGFGTTEQGIKAGIGVASTKGLKIQYVMADTQSTAAGALAAAQQLVADHVFAVLEISSDYYGAAAYLAAQHVPVIGGGFDGPEWATSALSNLFDVTGSADYSKVATTYGTFFKSQGVTTVGVLGYGISSTSAGAASGAALSAQQQGMKIGYQNINFTFGSTDVQPVALAMKAAGVDGVYVPVVPSTGFALAAALSALGVHPKAFIMATGYGGDLLESPAGVQAAQGLDFATAITPVDLNTPGTQQFQAALKTYAGVTGIPTFAEYEAYVAVAGLVDGLQRAGSSVTPASFTTALRGDSSFDGFGLYGSHHIDFSQFGSLSGGVGPDNCMYFAKLSGTTFSTISGAAPTCGTIIPGLKANTGS